MLIRPEPPDKYLALFAAEIGTVRHTAINYVECARQYPRGPSRCGQVALAQSSVWWPGLSRQLEELVMNCTMCALKHSNTVKPMIASDSNLRPWQKVDTDMFYFKVQEGNINS